MSDKIYRAAVVGLSGIGMRRPIVESGAVLGTPTPHSHVGAYSILPQTELVAVCDIKTDLLDQFKKDWGDVFPNTHTYTNYREMIDKENLDIINVATPDDRHKDVVIDASNSGIKGIVCEKPMSTTVADCDQMIEVCKSNGSLLSVDHTRRWWPSFQAAQQAIREGVIGEVKRIVGHWGGPRAMLFRNGTHLIDGVCFFANSDPQWIFAELDDGFENYFTYQAAGGRDPSLDPGASGYIHFKNGVRAFVNCSKGQNPGVRYEIIGETGSIEHDGDTVTIRRPVGISERLPQKQYAITGIPAIVAELIRVIEHGGELICPGREGKKVVEILVAFLKSQELGNARVDLPIATGR